MSRIGRGPSLAAVLQEQVSCLSFGFRAGRKQQLRANSFAKRKSCGTVQFPFRCTSNLKNKTCVSYQLLSSKGLFVSLSAILAILVP